MSYLIGDLIEFAFDVLVDDVDTEPTAFTVVITKPDGSTVNVATQNPHDGQYTASYAPDGPGHYVWVAVSTGTAKAAATGMFDVYDPASSEPPLVGVVQPWCDAAAVATRPGCDSLDPTLTADAARVASELLYALSGRQFAGSITTTVRPNSRPGWADAGAWGLRGGFGWYSSWGVCGSAYGSGYGGAALASWLGHSCRCQPAEVELGGYPVTGIVQVKINGEVIPPDEYRIDDYRLLVRVRPTVTSQPTERAGWPVCQRLDLPDTEDGTFSVTFTYGTPPPAAGRAAAVTLAAELALMWANPDDETVRLPQRIRSITRQGESIALIDPQEVLDSGRTGLPDVDLFIKTANPKGLQRRAQVWSPDLGRARRPTS